ncbi:hypothetical protein D1007_00131 [Hordeum vulgare]|nr:hypothetical protein D1007_00131 [Hordeum vulgare]
MVSPISSRTTVFLALLATTSAPAKRALMATKRHPFPASCSTKKGLSLSIRLSSSNPSPQQSAAATAGSSHTSLLPQQHLQISQQCLQRQSSFTAEQQPPTHSTSSTYSSRSSTAHCSLATTASGDSSSNTSRSESAAASTLPAESAATASSASASPPVAPQHTQQPQLLCLPRSSPAACSHVLPSSSSSLPGSVPLQSSLRPLPHADPCSSRRLLVCLARTQPLAQLPCSCERPATAQPREGERRGRGGGALAAAIVVLDAAVVFRRRRPRRRPW